MSDGPSPRGRVLVAVESAPGPVTAAGVARQLDLHASTVRFHLRKLLASGLVTEGLATADGPGRPTKTYRPAPPRPTDRLLDALVEVLLRRGVDAVEVGREWAAQVAGPAALPPGTVSGPGSSSDAAPDPAPDPTAGTAPAPDPVETAAAVLTALGFEIQSASSVFGRHEIAVCSCPLRAIAGRDPGVARDIQRGAVEYALGPGFAVESRPDPRHGDCRVAIRFHSSRDTRAAERTSP